MRTKSMLLTMIVLAIGPGCWSAETPTPQSDLERDVKLAVECATKPYEVHPSRDLDLRKYGMAAVPVLRPYLDNEDRDVRRGASIRLRQIAEATSNLADRQRVVDILVSYLEDSAVADSDLFAFRARDFSERSKIAIAKRIETERPRSDAIMLVGVADARSAIPKLRSMLIDEKSYKDGSWSRTIGWRARLALARMGSEEDVRKALEAVDAPPTSSRGLYICCPMSPISDNRRPYATSRNVWTTPGGLRDSPRCQTRMCSPRPTPTTRSTFSHRSWSTSP